MSKSTVFVRLLLALSLLTGACGGGSSDGGDVDGDIVVLTATINGQPAAGQMTLQLVDDPAFPVLVRYDVVSFTLLGQEIQLRGEGTVDARTAERRIVMSIEGAVSPPPVDVQLLGEGIARSVVPLRFENLVLRGPGVEVILSTD